MKRQGKLPISKAIEIMEKCYEFRANDEMGHLLNDDDIVHAISEGSGMTPEEAYATFELIYPKIKANNGRYVNREEEILIAMNVGIVKRVFGSNIPSREELHEYATIQAKSAGLPDVKMFIRHCECQITFHTEIGTPIPLIA